MLFCWTVDQVYRMLNAYRVLETLDRGQQSRFVAELQSLIVHISFENMINVTGRMLMDSPCDFVDETSNQNIERVNVLRPVQEQAIPLPFYTCAFCKVVEMKPEMVDVGLDPIDFGDISDLPSPTITGSGLSTQSLSDLSVSSGVSTPVSSSTPVVPVADRCGLMSPVKTSSGSTKGLMGIPITDLFKPMSEWSCNAVSTTKVPVASGSGVTPLVKVPSGSAKSQGAVPKLVKKKFVGLPYLSREAALANAANLAKRLAESKDGHLWHDATQDVHGCYNCGDSHRKDTCPFDRGTFCGSCGYPGVPGDRCPLCFPKKCWGLSPPSWYRGAKKSDVPEKK